MAGAAANPRAGRRRPGSGWGRALVAAYAFMALAACARSGVQIASRFGAAPLAFSLSAASGAVYLLAAVALSREGEGWWRLGTACCAVELAGVLAVGGWSLLDPALFPEPTVWSGLGSGYGCVPLALPLLGLAYQRRRAPGRPGSPAAPALRPPPHCRRAENR